MTRREARHFFLLHHFYMWHVGSYIFFRKFAKLD